ncbi:MAG TPA: MFS transporter [Candidatus Omnitrophota bacterium]|nr:MFS transporter [Candidatus Omnitrophota bacterium]HPD84645.1 MFS transporter [Candidatus Omnitrophota bacterium]HRZ03503.1 MFS transporter [Candidatus Omnitrophota bacterium]
MEQAANQPTHHVTARADRISFFQKFVYGMGSFVNQFAGAAMGSLILVLNLGLGVNPALVGTIGAIPRFLDAFSDPLIGYSSDNTRTRWGRRKPWILFGALSSGILLAMMFQLHPGKSEMFYFWWVLGIQCLFVIAFACYSIPWLALGYEMTPDYHERTRLQAVASFFGQPVWIIAAWIPMVMTSKEIPIKIWNWTLTVINSPFKDIVEASRGLAIFVGIFITVFGVLPALFNKELYGNLPRPEKAKGYKNVIKDILHNCATSFKCGPFVKLVTVTFLIFNGFMLASAFTAYVVFFYVFGNQPTMDLMYQNGGALLGVFGSLSAICTAFVAIPLTTWISTKLGKRKTFLITMSLAIFGYVLKWVGYNQQYPYLLIVAAPFLAFHLGSLFTIVCSMVADVCDLDELQTGTRREGMFSGIFWWVQKLGMAGASLLAGILLNATGFKQALGLNQTADALFYMRVCDVGIPIVTSLIAIYIIMTFDITEAKAYDIRQQVERRREDRRKEERRAEERRAEKRREEERRGRQL